MTYKFLRGISRRDDPIAKDLLKDLIEQEHLLTHEHTLKWFKEEHYFPGNVIDRTTEEEWSSAGSMTAGDRARKQASELIAAYPGITLRNEAVCELDAMMSGDARKYGLSTLPERD